uniref:SH3 domain-containing protein n=1 Tax=Mola mola TaxID=94237 RepID=A0A3Q3WE90_MOLML
MVSEIQVEDEETQQQLLQQGFLSTAASMEKITRTHAQLPRRPVPPPKPRRSKKESAALWEESVDSSSQDPSQTAAPAAGNLAPEACRMIAIFDYDPRESSPNTDIEAELTFSAGDIIHVFGDMDEDGFFYPADSLAPKDCSAQGKKKKGFFSKGKKLFKRLGSSKKE